MGRKSKTHGTTWTSGQLLDLVGAVTPAFQVAVDGLEPAALLQAVKSRREELGPVLNAALRNFLNGSQPQVQTTPPILDVIEYEITDEDTADLPSDRWQLVAEESVDEARGPVLLEEVGFHREGEERVGGEVMLAQAKEAGNRRGLRAARALERQQHLIPAEWRGKVLVFTGTVALDPGGDRGVPYLVWDGWRWRLRWGWLGGDWSRGGRLARSRT